MAPKEKKEEKEKDKGKKSDEWNSPTTENIITRCNG